MFRYNAMEKLSIQIDAIRCVNAESKPFVSHWSLLELVTEVTVREILNEYEIKFHPHPLDGIIETVVERGSRTFAILIFYQRPSFTLQLSHERFTPLFPTRLLSV